MTDEQFQRTRDAMTEVFRLGFQHGVAFVSGAGPNYTECFLHLKKQIDELEKGLKNGSKD